MKYLLRFIQGTGNWISLRNEVVAGSRGKKNEEQAVRHRGGIGREEEQKGTIAEARSVDNDKAIFQ